MRKEVSGLELRTAGIEPPDHFRAEKDLQEKDEMDSFESNFAKKKKKNRRASEKCCYIQEENLIWAWMLGKWENNRIIGCTRKNSCYTLLGIAVKCYKTLTTNLKINEYIITLVRGWKENCKLSIYLPWITVDLLCVKLKNQEILPIKIFPSNL